MLSEEKVKLFGKKLAISAGKEKLQYIPMYTRAHKIFEFQDRHSIKTTLLYKLLSNFTVKNFVTNLYCFYL